MHSTNLRPAGKAVEMRDLGDQGVYVRTKVVDAEAQKLVEEGVYQAYSVGISQPRIIHDTSAKGGRVVDGVFSEISLVDFPANPRCRFQLAKRASATAQIEDVEKVFGADLIKRDFDRGTGGGVDRDKLPAADFAGPDRTFPIVIPKDVHDAGTLIGHADNPGEVKARIIEIAHRKGPEFVAELPDSWKEDDTAKKTDEPDVTKASPNPDCPTCHGKGTIRDGHVDCPDCMQKAATEPEVTKGRRDCPDCGKSHDADSDAKHCDSCGAKLPEMRKAVDPEETKAADGKDADGKDADDHLAEHPEPDGDEDGPDPDNDGDGKDEPDDDQDGPNVEKAAYHWQRLHDGLCAAFTDTDVLTTHPALGKGIGAVVDAKVFADAVTKALTEDAGTGTRIGDLPALSEAYGLAVQLGAADPALLEAALGDVRKAFAEEYPNTRVAPSAVVPGKFKRPYLRAGRAPLSSTGAKPRIPLASHVPDAGKFDRGLITAGHEAASPAGKAGEPEVTKDRTFYTNAAKEQASSVLTAMHDYIAGQHPDLCPMSGEHIEIPEPAKQATVDTRAESTPQPVDEATAAAHVTKAGPLLDEDTLARLIKTAVADQTATMVEKVDALGKRVDDLAAEPAQPAVRNANGATLTKSASEAPVDGGDAEQIEQVVRLVKRAKHPDTTVSVPALQQLIETVGPDGVSTLLG